MQEELKDIEVTGSSGGGLVKVTMNGQLEVLKIELDPITVDPGTFKCSGTFCGGI